MDRKPVTIYARYQVRNDTNMVEFADEFDAVKFRANNPDFRRRKVRAVLQLYPSQVPVGQVVPLSFQPLRGQYVMRTKTTTATVDRKSVLVDTADEHAAHKIAEAAMSEYAYGLNPNEPGGAYTCESVEIAAHLPGHEYVNSDNYTRATIDVTPEIVARAKQIVAGACGD